MTASGTRRVALWLWSVGVVCALIFNRIWPPAAILFCLITIAGGLAGFMAPVSNRLADPASSYNRISFRDALLYFGMLVLPPIVDVATNGILCPSKYMAVWGMGVAAVGCWLPGSWYDRYREAMKARQHRFIERAAQRETVWTIIRATFSMGTSDYYETMTSKRRWVFVGSLAIAMVSVISMVWTAALGSMIHWMPMLTAPLSVVAMTGAVVSTGVMSLEAMGKVALQKELHAARDIQMGLMPAADPRVPGFDIAGTSMPAEEVGGDFYDYVWLDEQKTRLGIALADVSGKALKAAMTAVMTSGMLYQEAPRSRSPREILRSINGPMYLRTDKKMFTAMSFAVLDTRRMVLTISNAGQIDPLLLRNGSIAALRVNGAHLPLGIQQVVPYDHTSIRLRPGDTVVFATDGVPESMDEHHQLFGFERFESVVQQSAAAGSARELVDRIVGAAKQFSGTVKQHDDMTVVVLKVLPRRHARPNSPGASTENTP